jgi:hypothetical protein
VPPMRGRLPVVGSSVETTAFCSARLDGPDGLHLWFDGNGKITAGNGTLKNPRPNSISLPSQAVTDARLLIDPDHAFDPDADLKDCPGSTQTCRAACYVGPLSLAQRELYRLYEQNAATIRALLEDESLAMAWARRVAYWITTIAPAGFRWHVSGDVFSLEYAEWIAEVVRMSAPVRHWIYTRSFDYLAPLAGVATINGGTLALNLSCDKDNYLAARDTQAAWRLVGGAPRLCYLTVDGYVPPNLGPGDVIFPDYALRPRAAPSLADADWWQRLTPYQRGLVCPVDAHGKAENRRCGPCERCLK